MAEGYVSWTDHNAASYMWLTLLIARTLMLLGVHACLWNMVYEWYCEPTARFSRNPYYIYDAEKSLIRHLLNYVMLDGMSMWFFNTDFKILSTTSQQLLIAIAFCAAILTVCYTLRVLEYLMFKARQDEWPNVLPCVQRAIDCPDVTRQVDTKNKPLDNNLSNN